MRHGFTRRSTTLVCQIALAASIWGCAATHGDSADLPYRTVKADPLRNTDTAKRENLAGLEHLAQGDLESAEKAFSRSLAADVEFGPAHNNLGKVHYRRQDWYRAAWEFEYAKKLLPRHAEPANNLGLVLEQGGQLDRAVDEFRLAVSLDKTNIHYTANLARAMIRRGDRTDEVRDLLQQVVEKDTRPDWSIWARQQLSVVEQANKPF
jgi:Flp pilus assembly protein TadD